MKFICNKADDCSIVGCICHHSTPHDSNSGCELGDFCNEQKDTVKCIPVNSQGEQK